MMKKTPAHYRTLEYRRIKELVDGLQQSRGGALRVLDYGCGMGEFLRYCSGRGMTISGVDANPEYVARARDAGLEACGPEEFFASERSPYDVVVLSHLIEHLAPEQLIPLVRRLCGVLAEQGRLVIATPTPGERFYHDATHVRPYLPQSIRHAFGTTGMPILYGEAGMLELCDIHFFKDPYRTRSWRSFYMGNTAAGRLTALLNRGFDLAWRLSGGRIGVVSSWVGVYRLCRAAPGQPASAGAPAGATSA